MTRWSAFLVYNEMPARWLKPGGENLAARFEKAKDDAQVAREAFLVASGARRVRKRLKNKIMRDPAKKDEMR